MKEFAMLKHLHALVRLRRFQIGYFRETLGCRYFMSKVFYCAGYKNLLCWFVNQYPCILSFYMEYDQV